MYYRYATGWHSPPEVGAEFSLVGEEFGYVFPSDGGLFCIALSVPVADHEVHGHDPAGHLQRRLREHPSLGRRLDGVTWSGKAFTGRPADSFLRQAAGPGWALVGDAGTGQDPFAGFGMDTASRQAEALGEAFVGRTADWETTYESLWRERTLDGYRMATRFAPDVRAMLD
jgi:flavin-dependent dehydrogenase